MHDEPRRGDVLIRALARLFWTVLAYLFWIALTVLVSSIGFRYGAAEIEAGREAWGYFVVFFFLGAFTVACVVVAHRIMQGFFGPVKE